MDANHRFQVAATRAEAARSPEDWLSRTPSARADNLYRELRQLDMAAAAAASEPCFPDDLDREIPKAHRRVDANERRVATQMARIDEMQQKGIEPRGHGGQNAFASTSKPDRAVEAAVSPIGNVRVDIAIVASQRNIVCRLRHQCRSVRAACSPLPSRTLNQ